MKLLGVIHGLIFIFCIFGANCLEAQTIEQRFKGERKISYTVYFNAIPVGNLEWEYIGKGICEEKSSEIIALSSDAKILKLINIKGDERVFIDCATRLPTKVERDIVYFGKREVIEEIYNQEQGYVMVVNSRSQAPEIYRQDKPIHNILDLLYFFPQEVALKNGQSLTFNLPTQKITINMVSERVLTTKDGKKDTYFLIGRDGRRFNIWLDKEDRLPLRLEFILPLGKVSIVRRD